MPETEPATAPAAAEARDAPRRPRPRIKELEVMVAETIRETADATTLILFTGNDRLDYLPGHFLTIRPQQFAALERFCRYFEDVKGEREPARAYSLSSAPHEAHLAITIKEERYESGVTPYPPLLSPFLVHHAHPGRRMVVTGFGGPYVLPEDIAARSDHLLHVCAGSGIAPNWSILKHCLETGLPLRHTLVYGNKTWEDVIFRRPIDELAARFPDRLRVVHALSREPGAERYGGNVRSGRVEHALLSELIGDPTSVEVFACGPGVTRIERARARERAEAPAPKFLESTIAALEQLGVAPERIHHESFG